MYLIDETYFIKDINIPNKGVSLDVPNNEDSIEWYVDKYARQLLQNALGNVLFDELNSNIINGDLDAGAEQKWKDLVNGVSYTFSGTDYKWKGLIYTEGTFKCSVLAYYTYYHWLVDQISQTSSIGEVKGKAVNSMSVNSTDKVVKIWNKYIEIYQGSYDKTPYTFSIVNNLPFYDYYKGNDSDYVTLLTFLSHKEDDYPDSLMRIEEEGYQNTMGL